MMSNPVQRMHLYAARSSDVTAPLIYISFSWLIYQVVIGASRSVTAPVAKGNLTMTQGHSAILNCTTSASGPGAQVTWYRMSDGIQVTHNQVVMHGLEDRISVIADTKHGQYNLRISPVVFPDDNGAWRCSVFNATGGVQETSLNVIAPPQASAPTLSPKMAFVDKVNAEGFVYTCSAPPAYPPVSLKWVEKPKLESVDELERVVVDMIMEQEGITDMLQSLAAAQQARQNLQYPTGNESPGQQAPYQQQPPAADSNQQLPPGIDASMLPPGVDPAMAAQWLAQNGGNIPPNAKDMLPNQQLPTGYNPQAAQGSQGGYQMPNNQGPSGANPNANARPNGGNPAMNDMIPNNYKVPEGYDPTNRGPAPSSSREQPQGPASQTTVRASQEQEEEDRYAPFIPDGYRLPDEYRNRFPPGFEYMIADFLVEDTSDEDGAENAEQSNSNAGTRAKREAYGRGYGEPAGQQHQPQQPASHQYPAQAQQTNGQQYQPQYRPGYHNQQQQQQQYGAYNNYQNQQGAHGSSYPNQGQQYYPSHSQYPDSAQQQQPQYGQYGQPQGPAPNSQQQYPGAPQDYLAQSRSMGGGAAALASLDPLLFAELIHNKPDLDTLRRLAKLSGRNTDRIPTKTTLEELLQSFDKKELQKYAQYADFEPTPMVVERSPEGGYTSSIKLVLSPLHHGRAYQCVAEHPSYGGQPRTKDMLFAIADESAADKGFEAPFAVPTRTMGAGDVGIIVVCSMLLIVLLLAIATLFKCRHRWNLDIPRLRPTASQSNTYLPVPTNDMNGDCGGTITSSNNNGTIATIETQDTKQRMLYQRTRRRCIVKIFVIGPLLLLVLVLMSLMIPVYIRPFNVPVKGVDQIVTVMAGAQIWLDCDVPITPGPDVIQLSWRKNFTKYYVQHPVMGEDGQVDVAKATGRPANNDLGEEMSLRVTDYGMWGQIGISPAVDTDQGFYMCEAVRQGADGALQYKRKTFIVVVLGEMSLNYLLISMSAVGIIAAGLLILLLCYHTIRCRPPGSKKGVK